MSELPEPEAPKRSLKEKVNRGLAFVGIAAVSSGVMAEGALAAKGTKSGKAEAKIAAIDTLANKPLSAEDRFDEQNKQAVVGAIEKANHNKSPNLFYGAIFIPKAYDHKLGSVVHGAPVKNLWERPDAPMAGPVVLVNPVIEEYNGRLYAVVYNRGSVPDRAHPTGDTTFVFQDAATTGQGIWNNFFVDLGEAYKMNGGRIFYYSENAVQPQLVKSTVRDGIRYTADSDKFPQMTDVDGFWYGFSPDPNDALQSQNYMANHGFTMMRDTYVPTFQQQMVKESQVNTRKIGH